jgi:hypothetical protein
MARKVVGLDAAFAASFEFLVLSFEFSPVPVSVSVPDGIAVSSPYKVAIFG